MKLRVKKIISMATQPVRAIECILRLILILRIYINLYYYIVNTLFLIDDQINA